MPETNAHPSQRYAVARVQEIPVGARKLVTVAGRSLGVFNVAGTFVVVRNVCPHAGGPICRGRVGGTTLPSSPGEYRWGREGEILACPWHGWEFDLWSGRALAHERKRLRLYPVTVEDETIYITL